MMTWSRRRLLKLLGLGVLTLLLPPKRLRAFSQLKPAPSEIPPYTSPPESRVTVLDSNGESIEVTLDHFIAPDIPLVIYYPAGMTVLRPFSGSENPLNNVFPKEIKTEPLDQGDTAPNTSGLPVNSLKPAVTVSQNTSLNTVLLYTRNTRYADGLVQFDFPSGSISIAELEASYPPLAALSTIDSPNEGSLVEVTDPQQLNYSWVEKMYAFQRFSTSGAALKIDFYLGEANGSAFAVYVTSSSELGSELVGDGQDRFGSIADAIFSNLRLNSE